MLATTSALIAIGGNMGNSVEIFQQAIDSLKSVTQISPLYTSAAMYNEDQPDFINGAFILETTLAPQNLLRTLKKLEENAGRNINNTHKQYQPRPLDLDIIYYGDTVIEEHNLTVPHPLRLERDFVLRPLNDIAPSFTDPLLQKPLNTLWKNHQQQHKSNNLKLINQILTLTSY